LPVPIQIDKSAPVPLHDQIKEQVLGLIHAGRLKAGDQLPTMRELSVELGVNFNTVALAYRELGSQGVIATRRGEGTFVINTPAEPEMQQIRLNKLESMVKALLDDARRLGYSPAELRATLEQQVAQGTEGS
jgi:GntR family transcriptional regulator